MLVDVNSGLYSDASMRMLYSIAVVCDNQHKLEQRIVHRREDVVVTFSGSDVLDYPLHLTTSNRIGRIPSIHYKNTTNPLNAIEVIWDNAFLSQWSW